eukprot:TRINITY_DN18712_c0_g1_i1.p1 TRINITY_DN18712_c0_g1~~TRINITY_DN18712_c0_g1_i1.p1  ORF type:complete len:511 (+),score=36.68 TRINITY_DN18712_c0_g1_i1:82-1614(+)
MAPLSLRTAAGEELHVQPDVGEDFCGFRRKLSRQWQVEPWQVLLLDEDCNVVGDEHIRGLAHAEADDAGEVVLSVHFLEEPSEEVRENTMCVHNALQTGRIAWCSLVGRRSRGHFGFKGVCGSNVPMRFCPERVVLPAEDRQAAIERGDVQFSGHDSYLQSALRLLRWEPLLRLSEMLLMAGCDANTATRRGVPLLHQACHMGHGRLARLLLKHGANPLAICSKGWRALDYALMYFGGPAHETEVSADDLELIRVCCELQEASMPSAIDSVQAAQSWLRVITTQVALFKEPTGATLTRQDVLEAAQRQCSQCDIEVYGDALWEGWPWNSLSFLDIGSHAMFPKDNSFHLVRSRFLTIALDKPDLLFAPIPICEPCSINDYTPVVDHVDQSAFYSREYFDCPCCNPEAWWTENDPAYPESKEDMYLLGWPLSELGLVPFRREDWRRSQLPQAQQPKFETRRPKKASRLLRRAVAEPCRTSSKIGGAADGGLVRKRQARTHIRRQRVLAASS